MCPFPVYADTTVTVARTQTPAEIERERFSAEVDTMEAAGYRLDSETQRWIHPETGDVIPVLGEK